MDSRVAPLPVPVQAREAAPSPISVSVLIPNYNHAEFLERVFSALLNQTRAPDEVLILDDGSTDDSLKVMEEFARRFPKARILRNDRNRGVNYSINRMLELARGDYVVLSAADDFLLPEFLEKSLGALERHPDAGICFSEFVVQNSNGEVVNYSREEPVSFGIGDLPEYLSPGMLRRRLRRRYLWLSGNTGVVRRMALLNGGQLPDALEWYADWFAFYATALRHGVCLVPEGLAVIRANPGGYSDAGIRNQHQQRAVLRAVADHLKRPENRDLLSAFRRLPSLLSVFGWEFLIVLAQTPRHWDLLVPYLAWMTWFQAFRQIPRRTAHLLRVVVVRTARYLKVIAYRAASYVRVALSKTVHGSRVMTKRGMYCLSLAIKRAVQGIARGE